MPDRPQPLFWGLLALSVALVASAAIGGAALRDFRSADEVTVTGSARRPIRSDYAIWRGSVTVQRSSLQESYAEITRGATRVRAYLREQGLPDSVVTLRPIESSAVYEVTPEGRETGRVVGHRLVQWYEARSPDVDRITRLSQAITSLINEGIPLSSSPPEYLFTRLADVRVQMLSDATTDARARAQVIAKSAGSGIGSLRSVRMGVFQITPRFSTEVSDIGINDVSSIDKDITAVVRVTFGVR